MHCYFLGLDVHKQVIVYCLKKADGTIVMEGKVPATREALTELVKLLPGPWKAGLEATMFSHWIYRFLEPHALEIRMGNPSRLKAVSAGKNKSDQLDSRMLADLLRCELFPPAYVLPVTLEGLRRQLRFRRLTVQEACVFKNRTAALLMERGISYEKKSLHRKGYFQKLLKSEPLIDQELRPLLEFGRAQIEALQQIDKQILKTLQRHPRLAARVAALSEVEGVGPVTALTWALEVADPARFPHLKNAISYCGLCAAHRESAGKAKRGPLSKQRNGYWQSALVEAAKMAPLWNNKLKDVYAHAQERGHANPATLAVARKLVAYLLAMDRKFHAPAPGAASATATEVPAVPQEVASVP